MVWYSRLEHPVTGLKTADSSIFRDRVARLFRHGTKTA
jgi:hypothetical protein